MPFWGVPLFRGRCKPARNLELLRLMSPLRSSGLTATAGPLMRFFGNLDLKQNNVVMLCMSSGRFFECHACLYC